MDNKNKDEYRELNKEEIDDIILSIQQEIYGPGDYVPEKIIDSNGMTEGDYARFDFGTDEEEFEE